MSNYIKVLVLAEGRTEKNFIRDVLAPAMLAKNIYMDATLVDKIGGDVRFARAKKEIGMHLRHGGNAYITTMFDYFKIDPNWPGKSKILEDIQTGVNITAHEKGVRMEEATLEIIKNCFSGCQPEKRFIPYIQMHEFEALLFTDTCVLAREINAQERLVSEIVKQFNTPEDINDNPNTAPSKRIENLQKGYIKSVMGTVISKAIGIAAIREKCVHFDSWLKKIEELSS